MNAKPFLKWAGGKTQLLSAIRKSLPADLAHRSNLTYVEPFVGSGAVLFWFLQQFTNVRQAVINDINPDLTNAYTVIKHEPEKLITVLDNLQETYYNLPSEAHRKDFFLEKRAQFNQRNHNELDNTALLIFLNRTCFNGLYRVNSRNAFNVPFGRYANPRICDAATLRADSQLLQRITILNGDYTQTLEHVTENAFFYFDPPYKPISKTASFNAYSHETFNDDQQRRLADFCRKLHSDGYQWLLSNSDLKNTDENNHFFEELYAGFPVRRVRARRAINSDASRRGEISELLITNYV